MAASIAEQRLLRPNLLIRLLSLDRSERLWPQRGNPILAAFTME
jgi:hypothetical protein